MAEQKASDADREHATKQLRAAGGDGRLTIEELDERVQAAYEARTRTELERLLADLEEPRELTRPTTSSGLTVRPGEGGSRWVVALMSGATRMGHWRIASHCTVLSVMGGAEVDLTEAELASDEVTITVFSLMGGADIYVPEDTRIEVTDIGIMGGNAVERASDATHGPLIRLRLISIMGGSDVRRGSKATWNQRRRGRRDQRRLDRDAR